MKMEFARYVLAKLASGPGEQSPWEEEGLGKGKKDPKKIRAYEQGEREFSRSFKSKETPKKPSSTQGEKDLRENVKDRKIKDSLKAQKRLDFLNKVDKAKRVGKSALIIGGTAAAAYGLHRMNKWLEKRKMKKLMEEMKNDELKKELERKRKEQR